MSVWRAATLMAVLTIFLVRFGNPDRYKPRAVREVAVATGRYLEPLADAHFSLNQFPWYYGEKLDGVVLVSLIIMGIVAAIVITQLVLAYLTEPERTEVGQDQGGNDA